MASPPPPYANVTGISRAVMKDSPQESFANYNGNARAGELVVNLDVNPPTLYIGNSQGNLNQVTGGGNASLPLSNGNSQFDIAAANGNVSITSNGTQTWTFDTTGNLTVPKNILSTQSSNLTIASTYSVKIVGDYSDNNLTWTFDGGSGELQMPFGAIIDPSDDNFEVRAVENVNFEANAVVNIYTDGSNNAYQWQFGDNGQFNLAGGGSIIESIANSSLDPTLPNVSTMTLTPDSNYGSQVLVLDPTAPGHIHLRAYASSNIDEPSANIFLGGENTSFEVTSGPNNVARIHSGNLTWTFSNSSGASVLDLPGESYIRSNQDTVNIQSVDANNIGRGIYIGTNGALYFWDGNSQSVSLQQDNTNANLTAIGNASITSNVSTWTFGIDGNLTLPGNLISSGASPAPIISGFSSISSLKTVTTPQPLASLTATAGGRAFASDANLAAAGNFGANVSNGGANTVPVWSDGTNWYIG